MAVQQNYAQNILIVNCLLISYIYIFTDVISSHLSALPHVNIKSFEVISLLNYTTKTTGKYTRNVVIILRPLGCSFKETVGFGVTHKIVY